MSRIQTSTGVKAVVMTRDINHIRHHSNPATFFLKLDITTPGETGGDLDKLQHFVTTTVLLSTTDMSQGLVTSQNCS